MEEKDRQVHWFRTVLWHELERQGERFCRQCKLTSQYVRSKIGNFWNPQKSKRRKQTTSYTQWKSAALTFLCVIILGCLGFFITSPVVISAESRTNSYEWVQVSEVPRIYTMDNFLTKKQAQFVIDHCGIAQNITEQDSRVTGGKSRKEVRSSYSGWCGVDGTEDEEIQNIIRKIHTSVHIPERHGEVLQVGYYKNSHNFYQLHYDSSRKRPRYATILVYLNDCEEGGETIFPFADGRNLNLNFEETKKLFGDEFKEFCRVNQDNLRVKPKVGKAILFYNHDYRTQKREKNSLHGGCPPLGGNEKWFLTRFIRNYYHNPAGYFPRTIPKERKQIGASNLIPSHKTTHFS